MEKTKRMNRLVVLFTVFFFAIQVAFSADKAPKYIFLLIGDGMGTNMRTVADSYYQSKQLCSGVKKSELQKLEINDMPFTGNMTTFSLNSDITDSAAAVTAMSTGYKTNNGMIGVVGGSDSVETVAEYAKKNGIKVGILSSVWLNHATPAGFYAHQDSRYNYYEIAEEIASSGFDFFGASGVKDPEKGDRNIYQLVKDSGYTIIDSPRSTSEIQDIDGKLWLFDKNYPNLPYEIDGEDSVTLANYTDTCIERLYNSIGFFIMVEGGKIDWVCHSNDLASAIKETLAFNEAYKVAYEFYKEHSEDTLIIVVADHETGGLNLENSKIDINNFASLIDGQSGSDVKFQELLKQLENDKIDNEAAFEKMRDFFGLEKITESERKTIEQAYMKGGTQSEDFSYGNNHSITIAWTQLLAKRAGIQWDTMSHTSTTVQITAIGVGAEYFAGNIDNTCLARYIKDFIEQSRSELESQD
ncbi:MAG: alkaline phosphatase [Sedimentisphaeraceae bacterium JB056]